MLEVGDKVRVINLKGLGLLKGRRLRRHSVFLGKNGEVTEIMEGHPIPVMVDFGTKLGDFSTTYANFKEENLTKL